MEPGQRCSLNKDREAIRDGKGPGIADPFRKKTILSGESFWLLLAQDEVPNVQHHWEHPTIDFSAPSIEAKRNKWIQQDADALGVTYEQIMAAANYVVEHDKPAPYTGTLNAEELEKALDEKFERYDFWSNWADETLYEFENYGSACCPEYSYPECQLFKV
jgi:hypothetical protein